MRPIHSIVIHCSATRPNWEGGAREIRQWHVDDNNWSDIGYHFVIRRDGKVEDGRPVPIPGAHVKGYNKTSIGICLVGGVDENGDPDANFTRDQWLQLQSSVVSLRRKYPGASIFGHRDLDPKKDCPCFDVKAWWNRENR